MDPSQCALSNFTLFSCFFVVYCKRCNWRHYNLLRKCKCITPICDSMRIFLDIDLHHLYYPCKVCKHVHSLGHNEIPHFECPTMFNMYQSCIYSKTNHRVRKYCSSCCSVTSGFNVGYISFCPNCELHVLHFLNGKQFPVYDSRVTNVVIEHGITFTISQHGSCSVQFN